LRYCYTSIFLFVLRWAIRIRPRKAPPVNLKSALSAIVASPAVRRALLVLLSAIAGAAGFSQLGCHDLTPKQQARLDKFECQVAAVAPLVEPVHDAYQLVRDLREGKASLRQVLSTIEAGEPEVAALLERLDACEGEPESAPQPVLEPAAW
jgi:hypothetical protein